MRHLFFLPVALLPLTLPLHAAEPVDYVHEIKPILAKSCYGCHGPDKQRSGLRLDTAAFALRGGNAGPAMVPGKSQDSRLFKAVTGTDNVPLMPPKGPRLTATEVALLQAWIDQGAKGPKDEAAEKPARSKHWAFRAPVRPPEPAVQNAAWPRNAIDHFILARLEKEGIAPSPEADRVTLLRRVSLDLLGLPPSPREVEDFVNDLLPDAYERLVDRLLASPHYGERWGRHWLDLARYADSNGFSIDAPRSIWKYRDWVIDAINRDMPFDEFTIEQVAGDLLPNATVEQKIATGFHRNTPINQEGGIDLEQFRVESVVDRVNTTGAVWLGLTVGCAQCHDHKYDPIAQREFYQLYAFLNNADEPAMELPTPEQVQQRRHIQERIADLERQRQQVDTTSDAGLDAWEKKLRPEDKAQLPVEVQNILMIAENGRDAKQKATLMAAYQKSAAVRHALGGVGDPLPFLSVAHVQLTLARTRLQGQIAALKKSEPAIVTTLVMQERPTPRPTHVHLGGDFLRKGVAVSPGVPAALPPLPAGATTPNRLDLARWLVAPDNPLTARVTVNRLWQQYFGLGLVETDNDFGTQGTPPTHPELLDWLACEFMERGWSVKALHRLIVTSATYRQASTNRPELAVVDPRNKLLARQARLRLDAEVVRDMALSASGLLSSKIGGPSVFPPQPDGVYRFTQIPRDWKASPGADRYRRGMYTHVWRSAPHPGLTVFDAPESSTTCTRRNRSNTPLQALTLLNDQAFMECARKLAARVLREASTADAERIRYAFRLSMARRPSATEEKRLRQLLCDFEPAPEDANLPMPVDLPSGTDREELAAWIMVARALLNLDEFITRE
jgi:mono/diheme cytochrome c family protein